VNFNKTYSATTTLLPLTKNSLPFVLVNGGAFKVYINRIRILSASMELIPAKEVSIDFYRVSSVIGGDPITPIEYDKSNVSADDTGLTICSNPTSSVKSSTKFWSESFTSTEMLTTSIQWSADAADKYEPIVLSGGGFGLLVSGSGNLSPLVRIVVEFSLS